MQIVGQCNPVLGWCHDNKLQIDTGILLAVTVLQFSTAAVWAASKIPAPTKSDFQYWVFRGYYMENSRIGDLTRWWCAIKPLPRIVALGTARRF